MRASIVLLVAVIAAVGCKKSEKKEKLDPKESAPKTAEPAALTEVPVTTKSAEARAAFDRGRELTDKVRGAESVEHFRKAIELDPDFALAHAYLGVVTPGEGGVAHLDKAMTLAAGLPEAERLAIEARHLDRSGKHEEAFAFYKKVVALAPGDWRTQFIVGINASGRGDHAGAIEMFEKLVVVKPDLAEAQNGLAYAHAGLQQWEPAIAAAKRQVELMPGEPNPHDTLGEVLLLAGRFEEAEQAFLKATMDPKFASAWQGVGLARAYRGDHDGAAAAFVNQEGAAQNADDRVGAMLDGAWGRLAAGRRDQAIALLDKLEKDPRVTSAPNYAFVALGRAHMLQDAGTYAEAAKWYATGKKRGAEQSGASRQSTERAYALGMLRNAALSGRKPAAEEDALLAGLSEDAARMPGQELMQSFAAWARGLHAWAKEGAPAAVTELTTCADVHPLCRWDLSRAQREAGDTAAADATVAAIRARPLRDASAMFVWSKAASAK